MSATLTLHPANPQGITLSDDLKFALQKAYDNYSTGLEFGPEKLDFFLGLHSAGIKDAEKVMKAIHKYGSVILKWGY